MRLAFLDKIEKDKYQHYVLGQIVFFICYLILSFLGLNDAFKSIISILAVLFAAIIIEYLQRLTKSGTFEKSDIVATIIGGGFILLCVTWL